MENEGNVNSTINNEIAEVTFYHPKSNSLPGKLLRALARKLGELSDNNNVKVIILKSEGDKAFCAGASFDELLAIKDFESGKQFFMGFALLVNAMRRCKQFIIVRVQGKVVGGGVGIVAAADYAFALKSASVKLSELALGIGPFVVGPAVERKIGKSGLTNLSINYEWHSAEWAFNKGLYSEVLQSTEELDEAVNALAVKLAKSNPEAMKKLKEIYWDGTKDWNELLERRAEISGGLALSEFTKNYIQSFKNK